MSGYDKIARLYDAVNSEVDYAGYAAAVDTVLVGAGTEKGALVLELGCGTGRLTRELSALGYDMIGIDNSEEMLAVARESESEGILYLLQDMREFELYGTVAAAVCSLDGINHLTGAGELAGCFSLVHNYLDPDGVFYFDMNTPYKFRTVYGDRDYVIEEEGSVLVWRNSYNEKTKLCDFCMTEFSEEADGSYAREDTWWRERCYTLSHVKRTLEACGFYDVTVTADGKSEPIGAETERWFITAKARKNKI